MLNFRLTTGFTQDGLSDLGPWSAAARESVVWSLAERHDAISPVAVASNMLHPLDRIATGD